MPRRRNNGTDRTRQMLAQEAARIIVNHGVRDYRVAKQKAAERLGVHPTTLRRWSDNGDITTMLTPGGHRRFLISDLDNFSKNRRSMVGNNQVAAEWADRALETTRQEIDIRRDEN